MFHGLARHVRDAHNVVGRVSKAADRAETQAAARVLGVDDVEYGGLSCVVARGVSSVVAGDCSHNGDDTEQAEK